MMLRALSYTKNLKSFLSKLWQDKIKPKVKQFQNWMKHTALPNLKDGTKKTIEYSQLLWLRLIVEIRNLIQYFKIVYLYYPKFSFMKVDLMLIAQYLGKNPFKISKEFLTARGEKDIFAYGETPLSTMEKISKRAQITSKDTVYELGSGRGRTCFWLNSFLGCKVVGIEYIPEFVEKANAIVENLNLKGIEFKQEDMLEADLSEATVIYLYGTCLDEASIQKFVKKVEKLKSGTKIITVSYPLTDYASAPFLEVMRAFPAQFTWGETDVYIHYKK